jgi:hypothetical protein
LWRVSFRSETQTVLRDNWNGGKKGICPLSPPSLLPIPSDETINFLAAIPALYMVYKNFTTVSMVLWVRTSTCEIAFGAEMEINSKKKANIIRILELFHDFVQYNTV